jgi:hypothetical protein
VALDNAQKQINARTTRPISEKSTSIPIGARKRPAKINPAKSNRFLAH